MLEFNRTLDTNTNVDTEDIESIDFRPHPESPGEWTCIATVRVTEGGTVQRCVVNLANVPAAAETWLNSTAVPYIKAKAKEQLA